MLLDRRTIREVPFITHTDGHVDNIRVDTLPHCGGQIKVQFLIHTNIGSALAFVGTGYISTSGTKVATLFVPPCCALDLARSL